MRRRSSGAAVAVLALVTAAAPAQADHTSYPWSPSIRSIVVEDRTGSAIIQRQARDAIALWNTSGANFSATFRVGPADGVCAADGSVVRVCFSDSRYPDTIQGAWSQPFLGGDGMVACFARVHVASAEMFHYTVRHELGHCYGLGHTAIKGNLMYEGDRLDISEVPGPHDYEALRQMYGPAGGSTLTGVKFVTTAAGGVIDVPGSSTTATALIVYGRHGGANQQWTVTAVAGGYRLTNVNSGLPMTAMDSTDGAAVAQWPVKRSGSWQVWAIEASGSGYRLRNLTAGLCAEDRASKVVVAVCSGTAAQTWSLVA